MAKKRESGRVFAEGAALFARTTGLTAWTKEKVHGNDPHFHMLEWHIAHTPASSLAFPAELPGDPEASALPIPARYPSAGEITVAPWALRGPEDRLVLARFAIAWPLGRAVMFGEVPGHLLPTDPEEPYTFWMRRGKEASAFAPTFHLPLSNELVPAPQRYLAGEAIPSIATTGRILPVSELPAGAILH